MIEKRISKCFGPDSFISIYGSVEAFNNHGYSGCHGRRNGVSGCRNCCRDKYSSKYQSCVSECMDF